MSCCGKARAQAQAGGSRGVAPSGQPADGLPFGHVILEYTGTTSLAIIGPVTLKTYHFHGHGSRVIVDRRDSVSLTIMRALRRL